MTQVFHYPHTRCFLLGLRLCFVASASATKVIKVVADTADISAKRTSSSSISCILAQLGQVNYYRDPVDSQIHNKTTNPQQIDSKSTTSPQQVEMLYNKSTTDWISVVSASAVDSVSHIFESAVTFSTVDRWIRFGFGFSMYEWMFCEPATSRLRRQSRSETAVVTISTL